MDILQRGMDLPKPVALELKFARRAEMKSEGALRALVHCPRQIHIIHIQVSDPDRALSMNDFTGMSSLCRGS